MKRIIGIAALAILIVALSGCLPFIAPAGSPTTQVLNLAGVDPITLDPAVSGEFSSHQYVIEIFSGLVRLDDNMIPARDIAEKWDISPDGQTYTFHLRHDVRFQDGRAVKASDFKYSWERAANPATRSTTVLTYLGDIIGVNDVVAGKAEQISGVTVIDDYTLAVKTDAPKSYFLAKMAYPTTFVVDQANVEAGSDWWHKPNGTGPFMLKDWQPQKQLVLQKNPNYYGEPARLDQVIFQFYTGVPMNLYELGQIDVTDVGVPYIDEASDPLGPYASQLHVSPELSFYFIGFNQAEPPFDDVNIRHAFTMAIDKTKIISLMEKDMVQPANGILPPGMPGYNKDLTGLQFNVEQAKALITASKYGDVSHLPPITLTTSGWGGIVSPELEAVIQEWRQNLGVEVKIRQIEPERFLYDLKTEKNEMFDMGWVADYPHPQDFLDILFHSGGDNNYGEYQNPEVDALIDQANLAGNLDKSLALYQQAERKLVDDAACIPLWFGRNYTLVKTYVSGYQVGPLGLANLSQVSVSQ